MIPKEITPDVILGIIHRRKWIIFVPLLISMMIGVFLAIATPRIYKAETLILVTPPKVPKDYVRPVVSGEFESRLRTVSQQIMSRTRLEKVIKDLGLYKKRLAEVPMDKVIEEMRDNIKIKTVSGGRGLTSFSVSFVHPSPQICAKVANNLASLFIEENLKVREERAAGTTEFLEKELERLRKKLVSQEKAVKEYKRRHFGELPEQLQSNISTLERLQVELQSVQESLAAAKQRKLIIQQYAYRSLDAGGNPDVQPAGAGPSRLQTLYDTLDQLRSRYTGKHPDIIKIKREIARLEREYKAAQGGKKKRYIGNPTMQKELANVDAEIARLKAEEKRLKESIKLYQLRVENTPKREQELTSLTRDYNITLKSYQALLSRKIEAKLSENLEKKQQGEQFSVIDPAKPPQVPFKPNVKKILVVTLFMGLCSGGGLAVGFEYLDKTFHDKKLLEKTFDIPVIATIPMLYTREEKKRKLFFRSAYVILFIGVLVAYCFLLYYIKKNNLYLNISLLFIS